jgi:hypothetical protein
MWCWNAVRLRIRGALNAGNSMRAGEAQAGQGRFGSTGPSVTLLSPLVPAPVGYPALARAARNDPRGCCESLARSLDHPESALVYASRVDARQVDAAASTNGAFLRASLRISGLRPGFAKSDLNARPRTTRAYLASLHCHLIEIKIGTAGGLIRESCKR